MPDHRAGPLMRALVWILVLAVLGLAIFVGLLVGEKIDDPTDTPVHATVTTTTWVETQPGLPDGFDPVAIDKLLHPKPKPARRARTVIVAVSRPAGVLQSMVRAGFARFGTVIADQAVRVAGCESTGDPTGKRLDEKATNGAHAGLFQLSRIYHEERARRLGFTWAQMWDAAANIAVAVDLFAEKHMHWSPTWSCAWAA